MTPAARRLDEATDGAIARALAGAARFSGKKGELLPIVAPAKLPLSRIVLAGLGKPEKANGRIFEELGGALAAHLNSAGESEATVAVDVAEGVPIDRRRCGGSDRLRRAAAILSLRQIQDKGKAGAESRPWQQLTIATDAAEAAQRAYLPLEKTAEAVFFTRDLVSEPANVIYPETLAEQARTLEQLGVEVEVLDEAAMRELGMGALLGVAQGSARPPRLVVMQWHGARQGGWAGRRRSPLSARGSPSTPAASRSSPPPAWAR